MRRPARLAVVGLGRMGRLHARNAAGRVASARLVAVVDALAAVAREVGETYGVRWATSLEGVLSVDHLDAVVIAAPTPLHAELVEKAVAAGKHVLCEKPLGFEVEAARRAVAAATAAGVHVQVGFQRRFDPAWLAMKRAVDRGELGDLELFHGSHRSPLSSGPGRELGDVFVDVAIHDLDAARWLGGEVIEVFALAGPEGSEGPSWVTIMLRFENGALGAIDVSRSASFGFECSAELVGSRAGMRTGGRLSGDVELLDAGWAHVRLAADHAERHDEAYRCELDSFGAVTVGADPTGATGEDAVAALELALLARRSAAQHPVPASR